MSRGIKSRDLADFAPSLAACAIMLIVFRLAAIITFPVILVAGVIVLFCRRRLDSEKQRTKDITDSSKAMRAIDRSVKVGGSFSGALDSAHALVTGGRVGDLLLSVKKRIMFGQNPASAIDTALNGLKKPEVVNDAFGSLRSEYISAGGIMESAASSTITLETYSAEMKENDNGKLPRYLVAAMVSSTIIPAMLTFAFVGYSILYYSALFLMAYCTLLLGVVPSLYSVIRMKLVGVYGS